MVPVPPSLEGIWLADDRQVEIVIENERVILRDRFTEEPQEGELQLLDGWWEGDIYHSGRRRTRRVRLRLNDPGAHDYLLSCISKLLFQVCACTRFGHMVDAQPGEHITMQFMTLPEEAWGISLCARKAQRSRIYVRVYNLQGAYEESGCLADKFINFRPNTFRSFTNFFSEIVECVACKFINFMRDIFRSFNNVFAGSFDRVGLFHSEIVIVDMLDTQRSRDDLPSICLAYGGGDDGTGISQRTEPNYSDPEQDQYHGRARNIILLGEVPSSIVHAVKNRLLINETWHANRYCLFDHNCNEFSDELVREVNNDLPVDERLPLPGLNFLSQVSWLVDLGLLIFTILKICRDLWKRDQFYAMETVWLAIDIVLVVWAVIAPNIVRPGICGGSWKASKPLGGFLLRKFPKLGGCLKTLQNFARGAGGCLKRLIGLLQNFGRSVGGLLRMLVGLPLNFSRSVGGFLKMLAMVVRNPRRSGARFVLSFSLQIGEYQETDNSWWVLGPVVASLMIASLVLALLMFCCGRPRSRRGNILREHAD